jgi:hypothetical protein
VSIFIEEKWDGRRQTVGEQPAQQVGYLIFGTDDDTAARDAMVAGSPTFWSVDGFALPRNRSEIVGRLTLTIWEGMVDYGWNQPLDVGEELLSFDTSGGTRKVFQSYGTQSYAAPGQTAPDYQGAIGVTDDGVAGVDVIGRALSFSRQRRFAPDWVTSAWINAIAEITGCYNDAPFFGFDAGEVRFDGASGQQRKAKPWDITFKFTQSPNASDLALGPITVTTKMGWDYLWVRYRKVPDTTANRLVQRPLAAYVEKVLTPASFSVLGIDV